MPDGEMSEMSCITRLRRWAGVRRPFTPRPKQRALFGVRQLIAASNHECRAGAGVRSTMASVVRKTKHRQSPCWLAGISKPEYRRAALMAPWVKRRCRTKWRHGRSVKRPQHIGMVGKHRREINQAIIMKPVVSMIFKRENLYRPIMVSYRSTPGHCRGNAEMRIAALNEAAISTKHQAISAEAKETTDGRCPPQPAAASIFHELLSPASKVPTAEAEPCEESLHGGILSRAQKGALLFLCPSRTALSVVINPRWVNAAHVPLQI